MARIKWAVKLGYDDVVAKHTTTRKGWMVDG